MPIYEYVCETGHDFEVRQSFHDDPVSECPSCRRPARRVYRPAPVIYKGSGFYTTDYARKQPGVGASTGASSSSPSSSSSSPAPSSSSSDDD